MKSARYLKDVCNLAEGLSAAGWPTAGVSSGTKATWTTTSKQDGMASLMGNLTYSTEDANQNRPARHHIPSVRNGTATLKQAAGLYQQFRQGAG